MPWEDPDDNEETMHFAEFSLDLPNERLTLIILNCTFCTQTFCPSPKGVIGMFQAKIACDHHQATTCHFRCENLRALLGWMKDPSSQALHFQLAASWEETHKECVKAHCL